jgi:GNAT superfamily N-acetyltransferase
VNAERADLVLPDVPRWVEAHGIASDPSHWRRTLGRGIALGHDAARLVVLTGDAEPEALASLPPTHTVLFAIEREDLRAALARPVERAILHTLGGEPADYEGAVLLPDDAPLPDYLSTELTWARSRGPIYTVYVDGIPSAFAYAPWKSRTYFDVSVDVVPAARQLGLATIVAGAMIAAERARGREPVWGADEGNAASLRLARRLGFTPVDELWVAPAS